MANVNPLGYQDTEIDKALTEGLYLVGRNCDGCSGQIDRQKCVTCDHELEKQRLVTIGQKQLKAKGEEAQCPPNAKAADAS